MHDDEFGARAVRGDQWTDRTHTPRSHFRSSIESLVDGRLCVQIAPDRTVCRHRPGARPAVADRPRPSLGPVAPAKTELLELAREGQRTGSRGGVSGAA